MRAYIFILRLLHTYCPKRHTYWLNQRVYGLKGAILAFYIFVV
jgi:hypothetical protein